MVYIREAAPSRYHEGYTWICTHPWFWETGHYRPLCICGIEDREAFDTAEAATAALRASTTLGAHVVVDEAGVVVYAETVSREESNRRVAEDTYDPPPMPDFVLKAWGRDTQGKP